MELNQLSKLEAMFHALLEIPGATERERAAIELSGGDAELARRALDLVISDERAEAANQTARQAMLAPRLYGNYRTVRLLGSGGMGAVYLADRADGQFQQTVAVKVIAPYAAGDAFRERFLAERQILAGLSHPNIAKLLDGGVTPDGTPYLVLEFVDGVPLDEYCDARKMGLRARLDLFRKLCEPIAYAHRSLVVHRDLKPSNILVTPDGRPVLLDFGTAKLLAGGGAGIESATVSPLLTLRYASPDQRSRAPLTTGSDVFSLGVILYELLTGVWPFGDPSSPQEILQRFSRETPMTLPANEVTEDAAVHRATSLKPLKGALAGDLTSIMRKAIAPAPDERYESVQALSADIGNWLEARPVNAKPATFRYQAGKFVRRNLAAVTLTAFAVVALLAVTTIALYQARLARERYADIRSLTASLLFELKDAINDVPGSTPAQQILVNRVLKNLDKMSQSSRDPELQAELGEAFRQLGELQGDPYSQNLGDSKGALASLTKARSIAEAGLRQQPASPVWLHLAGLIEATTAEVQFGSGRTAEAIALANRSTAYYEAMAPLTKNSAWRADAAAAYGVLGDMLGQNGTVGLADPALASSAYRRAIELDQSVLNTSPRDVRTRRNSAVMRMKLGDLVRENNPEEALKQFQDASTAFNELPPEELNRGANKRIRAMFLRKSGDALRDLQEWSAAAEYLQQALSFFNAEHAADLNDKRATFDLVVVLGDLADVYYLHQNNPRARPVNERILELGNELRLKEPANPVWMLFAAWYQVRQATYLARSGEITAALPLARDGLKELARISAAPGASPRDIQLAAEAFISVEPKSLRDPQLAAALSRRYLKATRPDNVLGLYDLAQALQMSGQADEAKAAAQLALAKLAPVRGGRVPYVRQRLEEIR